MHDLAMQVLRRLGDGGFHSGTLLARELDVSRSAISLAMKNVAHLGVRVYRIRGRGYCLETPIEFIDPARVLDLLGVSREKVRLEILGHADSTSTLLGERVARGAPGGLCILAEHQSAGRGRLGRIWHSGLGGALTFSLLWRFGRGASQLAGLSLAVSLAAIRSLRECGVSSATVKWPNDVLVNFRKLAGILIETQGDMLGPSAAVIGVGVNYRLDEEVKDRIDQAVVDIASLADEPVSRNVLFASLLKNLVEVLEQFERDGFIPFMQEWLDAHACHGRAVRVTRGSDAAFNAVVEGVAEDGALLVKAGKHIIRLASAEISLRTV
jgi:BirA family biotin operon repressor/biotin-[acetyl-CoA-carboxylase] ligase